MKRKNKQIFLLVFLISLLIIMNYSFIDNYLVKLFDEKESVIVERVIDGDTIVIENKTSVRLLGINCPEKGEEYYLEAKEFLEREIDGKNVRIERSGKDKYFRELGYIFVDGRNINLELVEKGFANVYILDNKKYEEELRNAWEKCIYDEENLCEKSVDVCFSCIELKEFDYLNQRIVFYNKCDFDCDLENWKIKDEGRKNFVFPEFVLGAKKEIEIIVGEGDLFWDEKYVWTKTGDTLFLRDSENKLVLWENY
jgi:micrococcal nuclease